MTEVHREVAESYSNDGGRCIARVDPETLLKLDLEPGDYILITSETHTFARAWRADREDWESGEIRIDRFTRHNAQVEIGDRVTLRKANLDPFKQLKLIPYLNNNIEFTEGAIPMIRKQLEKKPLKVGDVLPVQSSHDVGQIGLVATGPATKEPGLIVESTTIEVPDGYMSE
jgi:transitional endoplasmic reticulum ATPase